MTDQYRAAIEAAAFDNWWAKQIDTGTSTSLRFAAWNGWLARAGESALPIQDAAPAVSGDTPRTDAAVCRYTGGELVTFPRGLNPVVPVDFARTLERDLASMKSDYLGMCQVVKDHEADLARLTTAERLSATVAQPMAWLYESDGFADAFSKTRLPLDKLLGNPRETPLYAEPKDKP